MPTINGSLLFVSSRAAQVSEVWLHAREVRTHAGGVVTTGNDRFPVQDGRVEFTALPGPAVLALISQGRAVDTIPIVVGESEAQSLRNVVRAAQVVDEATSREIERLSAEMMEALDSAREEASVARGHAETAQGHANAAQEQVALARGQAEAASASVDTAREQATQAEGHASRAQSSAEESSRSADRAEGARSEARSAWDGAKEARDAAEGHASTAEGHANAAASSAGDAQGAAGRADESAQQVREIAESTRWDGDQVTVNGKQSPHLTGPQGERGPQGPPGEVENIDLDQYARVGHKHTMSEISDLPKISSWGNPNVIPVRDDTGRFFVAAPEKGGQVANKSYVDSQLYEKADKAHEHTMSEISDLPSVSASASSNSIAKRNSGGTLSISDPDFSGHAATKRYVDKEVRGVRDRVGELESRIQLVNALPDNPDPKTLYLVGE